MAERTERPQVRDEPRDRGPCLRGEAQDAGLPIELLEDVPETPVPPPRRRHDRRQVLPAEPVDVRAGQPVHVDARREIGNRPQERQQDPDLGPGVQAGRPGEPPRDRGQVQAAEDRVRVAVGADEDREVARPCSAGDASGDLCCDPVALLGSGRERLEPDRRTRLVCRTLGPEPLRDPRPDFEPIRIVEPDEAV